MTKHNFRIRALSQHLNYLMTLNPIIIIPIQPALHAGPHNSP